MKKFIKIFFALSAIVFILIQFVQPLRMNPISDKSRDVSYYMNTPGNVKQILERSCYDCHSNLTRWPWYSNIAPVSWLVSYDVEEGRSHMNFSEWGTYNITDQISNLDDIVKEIKKGEMPLGKYLILHPDAKLSDAEKESIIKWAGFASDSIMMK